MRSSDSIGDLVAAMAKAAKELKDPGKGRTADTGKYSYTYAGLPDFMPDCRKVLAAHGLILAQSVEGAEMVTTIAHSSGQWLATVYPIRLDSDPQKQGSAHTYARRYSLLQTLSLAPDDDDDGQAAAAPSKWPETDRRYFCAQVGKAGYAYEDVAAWCESMGWGRPSGWSRDRLEAFIGRLEPNRAKLDAFIQGRKG